MWVFFTESVYFFVIYGTTLIIFFFKFFCIFMFFKVQIPKIFNGTATNVKKILRVILRDFLFMRTVGKIRQNEFQ